MAPLSVRSSNAPCSGAGPAGLDAAGLLLAVAVTPAVNGPVGSE